MTGIDAVLSRIQTIEQNLAPTSAAMPMGVEAYGWGASATTGIAGTAGTVGGAGGAVAGGAGDSAGSVAFAQALAQAGLGPTTASALSGATSIAGVDAAGRPGEPTGQDLIAEARKYIGVPYVWGGESAAGLDCSGLVKLSLANLGVDISRTARQQGTEGHAVASLEAAKPGDLLIFNNGTHVGIYLGEGRMIDAPYAGRTVTERDVYETPTAIRRVLPSESAQTDVAAGVSVDALASLAGQRQSLAALMGGAA